MHILPPHTRGSVMVLVVVFMGVFFMMFAGMVAYATSYARLERQTVAGVQALALAEAGIDKAAYELNLNGSYAGESNTALGNGTFTVSVASVDSSTKRITATGYVPNSTKPVASKEVQATVSINADVVSFHYGVQVGDGGVVMGNGAQIIGNLFSNGSVSGSGTITGDAIVARGGSVTSLSGITVQGSAYAHTLSSCSIGRDAYYQTISSCTVSGTSHPGSTDQSSSTLPISDAQITEWKDIALAGGTVGNQNISGTVSLGPKKIAGDLNIGNGATLNVTGTLWVTGQFEAGNNAHIKLDASYGSNSGVIVSDGTVNLSNGITMSGSGQVGSYTLLVAAKNDPTHIVMDISNNVVGGIMAAPHGRIHFNNNAGAKEVTGYGFDMDNNATVTYESGLQNETFSNGPGGSWAFLPGTYAIVP